MSELPQGWVSTRLGELSTTITKGTTPKTLGFKYQAEGVRFVKAESLAEGAINHHMCACIEDTAHAVLKRSQLVADDVLFTIAGTLGRVATVATIDLPANTNQAVAIIRLQSPSLAPYVARYAASKAAILAESDGRGTGLQNLNLQQVGDFEVAVPPLPEQRRIVAKIDSLTSKSRRARDHLDHIPRLVEKYKQAVLAAAFAGQLTPEVDASCFHHFPLAKVTGSTFYGPRIAKEAYVVAGVPTLRTTDIADWGRLVPKEPPQVEVSDTDFAKWRFENGDLMVTRTGATIGKCAVYEAAMGPALPSAYLIRVRLKQNEVYPRFAVLFLLSPAGQRQLLDGRTAVAQPNINADAITSVQLPLPPVGCQRTIVRKLDTLFARIDRLASEAASARRLIDRLDRAVLSKAFRGELVPQDPEDEPASVLLERIRAERGVVPKAKRGRKAKL